MKEKIKHLLGLENEEKDPKDKKKIENLVLTSPFCCGIISKLSQDREQQNA